MNTLFLISNWLRRPLLLAMVAGVSLLCGCKRTESPPAPAPAKIMQAPSPGEVKLGPAPRMPEEKK
ncbi:MAG: hypothetical protein WCH43_03075 [Verrucomicrobiota bacterium]